MKKLLLIANNSLPCLSSLINIAHEKTANQYDIKFFLDCETTVESPLQGLLQNLGFFCYKTCYENFEEKVNAVRQILYEFTPDFVIFDNSYAGALAVKLNKHKNYYSIMRRFNFPGSYYNDIEKNYYQELLTNQVEPVFSKYTKKTITDPRELLLAKTIFIPSIPYFDHVPKKIDPSCNIIYTGPLLWDIGDISDETKAWLVQAQTARRPMVLFSTGLLYDPTEFLINFLPLANNCQFSILFAYNGSVNMSAAYDKQKFHFAPLLPIRYISRFFNIMLHHGGHQSSLLAMSCGLPTVTFNTGHPEWEENAIITEALCTNIHTRIPSPESIINNLESCLNNFFIRSTTKMTQKNISTHPVPILPIIDNK